MFSYTIIIIGLFFFFLPYKSEQSPNVMISYISFHTHWSHYLMQLLYLMKYYYAELRNCYPLFFLRNDFFISPNIKIKRDTCIFDICKQYFDKSVAMRRISKWRNAIGDTLKSLHRFQSLTSSRLTLITIAVCTSHAN